MPNREELLDSLPKIDQNYDHPSLSMNSKSVIIVLDDDPTGTQTVHGVAVVTEWSEEIIKACFEHQIFFILTNSRSLEEEKAYQCVFEICTLVKTVAQQTGKRPLIITRTDSTLRGHFKIEPDAVADAMILSNPLRVFSPTFLQGGRYTIANQHYVLEQDELIKASETPFAKDKTFGYHSSELYDYILEKDTEVTQKDIFDFSIEEIRNQDPQSLKRKIALNTGKKYLIINAADASDLNKVAEVLNTIHQEDFPLIIRSAAGIVPALGGIIAKPLLEGKSLKKGDSPGLIVVGSYVPKSTEQLAHLLEKYDLERIELDVDRLLNEGNGYLEELKLEINKAISGLKDCVLYTSRKLSAGIDKKQSLLIVNQVSDGVIEIVSAIENAPSFVIAKGGITSSDVATKALKIRKAEVLGQLIPGVPVWKPAKDAKYPDMPYIIFPGNVGSAESLTEVYEKITH